jgi:aspartokinase/homoserine dehydrogenase 1
MYTANPKIVKQAPAYCIYILSGSDGVISFWAKVLFPPTIQPVLRKNIPIHIKNTFEPEAGTYISNTSISNGQPVKGISHIENITLIPLKVPVWLV